MSKKTETTEQTQQPDFVKELLEKGSVTITSLTREDFDTMLKEIPSDVKYGAGAVGRDRETGVFTLQLDLTLTSKD